MNVSQLMRHGVRSCSPQDSLHTAAQLMWDNDCGCLPVRDDGGRVVGMITDRDICMAAYLQGGPLCALKVSSAMSHDTFACRADDTIAQAEATMRAHQVRRLPVLDREDRLVGILSLNDIALEAGEEMQRKQKAVNLAEIGRTLEAICRRRNGGELRA
ncbi:MAG TPA: CBS domain-containing protein [Candidatus Dormibacteraeota bacterium]|nr:CBS domain-containing protein [Candidatus Dormibacteraeota bacterium]